jgi:hypothetical protein
MGLSKDQLKALADRGEAASAGAADQNGAPPAEMRAPTVAAVRTEKSIGPAGEYLPATYETIKGNIRTDR